MKKYEISPQVPPLFTHIKWVTHKAQPCFVYSCYLLIACAPKLLPTILHGIYSKTYKQSGSCLYFQSCKCKCAFMRDVKKFHGGIII